MDTERIQNILSSTQIVPFTVLSDLARGKLRTVFESKPSECALDNLQQLWLKLQWTACSSTVVERHLTEACNALCVFIHCACCSSNAEVKDLGFSEKVWSQTLEVIRKAFGDGNVRPALATLETLVYTLLHNEAQDESRTRLKSLISEMIDIVLTGHPVSRLKEACVCLSLFVKRTQNIVPVSQYLESFQIRLRTLSTRLYRLARFDEQQVRQLADEPMGQLMLALLLAASLPESRTAATKVFSLLCSKAENFDLSVNVGIASAVIDLYLQANSEVLEDFSMNVFPAVLNSSDQFDRFSNQFNPAIDFSIARLSVYLAIIQVGRQKGFVTEEDLAVFPTGLMSRTTPPENSLNEDYAALRIILKCSVGTIRLQAFRLLTTSVATSASVPQRALQCFQSSFHYLQDDTDPAYRDGYVGICRRLILYMDRTGAAYRRTYNASANSSHNTQADYSAFLMDWNSYLQAELSPQVSYQRHILALRILQHTIPPSLSNIEGSLTPRLLEDLTLALLALIFDAFDDVRSQATKLLMIIGSYNSNIIAPVLQNLKLINLASQVSAKTKRADHADALGRLLMLDSYVAETKMYTGTKDRNVRGYEYIKTVSNSINDYLKQVTSLSVSAIFPLHGTLLSLANMLHLHARTPEYLQSDDVHSILRACSSIWFHVQKDLCIDSPETEADDDEQLGSEGPKDLLAYSWRALRDSSLVLQALLDTQLADSNLYQTIGQLCLDQLINLRHRGAFSTVAQTFYLCCGKSRSSTEAFCHNLSEPWLKVALHEIDVQSNKLTRRSAGIPSMFTALLDPTDQMQFLGGVQSLTEIARAVPNFDNDTVFGDQRLPQVHALNSLKDVMTNSRFRTVSEPLVVEMLNLSASCLSSGIWAIRNCGLMLFRACVNRLTPESSTLYGAHVNSVDGSSLKTPLAVAVNLLQDQHQHQHQHQHQIPQTGLKAADAELESRNSEIVFAALELLGKIPSQPEYEKAIEEIVRVQLASRIWAVRDHAARLLASRATMYGIVSIFSRVQAETMSLSSNEAHGHFLYIRYIIQNRLSDLEQEQKKVWLYEMIAVLEHPDMLASQLMKHPVVLSATLDILNDVFTFALREEKHTHEMLRCSNLYSEVSMAHEGYAMSFLLRRATSLNLVLIYVCSRSAESSDGSKDETTSGVIQALLQEEDIAIYTVQELAQRVPSSGVGAVLEFLSDLPLIGRSSDVQTAILQGISDCLSVTQLTHVHQKLDATMTELNLLQARDRDLWNAHVRAISSFIQVKAKLRLSFNPALVEILVNALRLSQQDEVEMPTRLLAVEAIVCIAPALLFANEVCRDLDASVSLRLLVLLYDFLNDDDVDVRELAMRAASWKPQDAHILPQVLIRCAVAARNELVERMVSTYHSSGNLVGNACMRIIGALPAVGFSEVESITAFCHEQPVARLIGDAIKRAHDLFIVERQNLYVDDVEEIKVWATVASQCQLDQLDLHTVRTMMAWTITGLQYLSAKMEGRSDIGNYHEGEAIVRQEHIIHPLGLTYNAEMLTIYVRVIALANLMKSQEHDSWENLEGMTAQQQTVSRELRVLHDACVKHGAHPQVISVLEYPLRG